MLPVEPYRNNTRSFNFSSFDFTFSSKGFRDFSPFGGSIYAGRVKLKQDKMLKDLLQRQTDTHTDYTHTHYERKRSKDKKREDKETMYGEKTYIRTIYYHRHARITYAQNTHLIFRRQKALSAIHVSNISFFPQFSQEHFRESCRKHYSILHTSIK